MLFPARERRQRILGLGLPIFAGVATNSVMGLVDMAFVGGLGSHALAAVGLGSFMAFVYFALFMGLSIAVQATASRLKGAGRIGDTGVYLNAALLLVLLAGPPITLLIVATAPIYYTWMNDDPNVIAAGVPYVQWMMAAGPFMGINAAFSGYWNAIDRSQIYMRVVVAMNLVNIPLNYIFIFGIDGWVPAYGAEGAGIGTFLTAMIGAASFIAIGMRHARVNGFMRMKPAGRHYRAILRLAFPGGTQQVLDNFALAIMYRIVGMIGTAELAAYSVLINLIVVVGLPGWALGTAGATLVGQALGKGQLDDARQWGWDVIKFGMACLVVFGGPLLLVPELVLSIFIHDPSTMALAVIPAMILGGMIAINGVGYMTAAMLNGAGDVDRVMYVNIVTQYFVLLPAAYLFGLHWGFGLIGVWLCHQVGFRAVQSVIFGLLWRGSAWTTKYEVAEVSEAAAKPTGAESPTPAQAAP